MAMIPLVSAAGSSFTKALATVDTDLMKAFDGSRLAQGITESTLSRRVIQTKRQQLALQNPGKYLKDKIELMEKFEEYLKGQILTMYEGVLMDGKKQRMTSIEAKVIAQEFGSELSKILEIILEKIYPSGTNDAVETLLKEETIAGSMAGKNRTLRRK